MQNDYSQYAKHYSDDGFMNLARNAARKVPFLKNALAMYHCLNDKQTPAHVKALIVGALGYFVLPVDLVPDLIPIGGWLDDSGVIAATLLIINSHILPEHWQAAEQFATGAPYRPDSSYQNSQA